MSIRQASVKHDDSRSTHWHRSIVDTVADVVAVAAASVAVAVDVVAEYDAVVVIIVFVADVKSF